MSQKDEKDESATLNVTELLARVENDRELLREMVAIFKDVFPALVLSLREAIQANDMQSVAIAGHTLKGMLSNLAAHRAAATAGRLEHMGAGSEREGMNKSFAELENEISLLLPELELCAVEMNN